MFSFHLLFLVLCSMFRDLVGKYHPDKGGSAEMFDKLRQAQEVMLRPPGETEEDSVFQRYKAHQEAKQEEEAERVEGLQREFKQEEDRSLREKMVEDLCLPFQPWVKRDAHFFSFAALDFTHACLASLEACSTQPLLAEVAKEAQRALKKAAATLKQQASGASAQC